MLYRVVKNSIPLIACIIAACLGPLTCRAQQSAAGSTGGLEEIVVTASKRPENLQIVPVSVTGISEATLETQGITGFSDYLALVPGLADYSAGAIGHGAIILRALNTGYYSTSNTVGFYVDDIPFSATSSLAAGAVLTQDPGLVDVDHIEVLKGPQATLYGATTLGGLIKFVTNKPDLTSTSGSVRTDGSSVDGGGVGFGLEGVLNLPIIQGSLAMRASAFDRETPGYMTNTTLGTTDRGVAKRDGGRIALRWVPQEDLDILMSVFAQSLREDGWNNEYVNLKTLAPIAGNYTYQSPYDPTFHTTYRMYDLAINYTAGSVGKLTSSTSYAMYEDQVVQDYSPYASVLNAYAPTPAPADAAQLLFWGPKLKKLSEELRFSSNRMGHFEWLAGLFFTREQLDYPSVYINAIPPSQQQIPGPDGQILGTRTPGTYKERAAFADLTYYLKDDVDLTVGGRYSRNEQVEHSVSYGFVGSGANFFVSTSDTDLTYQIALRWRLTPQINTYARVATSYRPGGPQLNQVPGFTSFNPDSLISYEVGEKGVWRDDTLRVNLAIYYMDWKDVQINAALPSGYVLLANGGKATSKGVELETQFMPINRFTIGATLAYSDAKLVSVSPDVSAATGAVAGDTLPYTPKWAGSASADYVWPLNAHLDASVGTTYRYQGSKISDYPGDTLNTAVNIPAYRTVDVRTGLNWSRYKAQLRVANLFNERGLDNVVDQRFSPSITPPAWATILPPRTFTLSLSATF